MIAAAAGSWHHPPTAEIGTGPHSTAVVLALQRSGYDVDEDVEMEDVDTRTMNVQDLASLTDQILQITGLRVRETVPDWIFQQADEVIPPAVESKDQIHPDR